MPVTRLFIIFAGLCSVLFCDGRRINSTRGKLKLVPTHESITDTIRDSLSAITIAGFEKAQNSSTESFFVINKSKFFIKGINLSVEYLNLKGYQLHLNTLTIPCDIPPMQTRSLNMKSWDRQHLWYYVGTQGRHNDYCNPFDVHIRINYITVPSR